MRPVTNSRSWWSVAAIATAIVCASPTLLVLAFNADYFVFANESTAYRFFYVQRLIDREPVDLFLPQGYLTTLVHRIVYSLVVREHPIGEAIRQAITNWGVVSGLFWHTTLGLALLLFVRQSQVTNIERLAVLVAAMSPLLCTASQGFYYTLLPDYLQVETVLAALTTMIFLVVLRRPAAGLGVVALLGVWIGLVSSNKVTWLPFAAVVLTPVIARRLSQPVQLLTAGAVAASCAAVTFFLVHLAVYGGDVERLVRLAPIWFRFIQTFTPEPGFWEQFVQLYLVAANVAWISLIFLSMLAVAVVRIRREQILPVLAIVAVAGGAFSTLMMKPAGTTTYDTLTMLLALTAMLIGGWHADPLARRGGYLCVTALAAVSLLTFPIRGNCSVVASSGASSASRWEIHRSMLTSGRPAVFVWLTNEYQFSSVEEALIKGFVNPGTAIFSGGPGVERVAPEMTFRIAHGSPLPSDPYPDGITLGFVDRPDREPLTSQLPTLADAVARAGDHCRTIDLRNVLVTICDVP